jgi:hypothetical protein
VHTFRYRHIVGFDIEQSLEDACELYICASIELLDHFPIDRIFEKSLMWTATPKVQLKDAVDAGVDIGTITSFIYAIVPISTYSSIASIELLDHFPIDRTFEKSLMWRYTPKLKNPLCGDTPQN